MYLGEEKHHIETIYRMAGLNEETGCSFAAMKLEAQS